MPNKLDSNPRLPTTGGHAKPPAVLVEALLIGGPRDGARIQVEERMDIVHVISPRCVDLGTTGLTKETYHRVPFGLSDGVQRGEFVLYLHSSIRMDMFDVVQRLFMGYREES